jgi:Ni/Fe-hydrogenase subunit HybB-like protein
MSATFVSEPVNKRFLTPGVMVLMGLIAIGFGVAVYRFVFGLAAVSNLTDQYPWGIWIAIDVATGVALAAGGFTTAALTHIFHRHRYEAVMRPALLTAMLGYTFVALGLMVDLGRYYNIWHPMLPSMWQGNSALFEVAMCVMAYLTVLYIEFMPAVCERFIGRVHLPGRLSSLNAPIDALLRVMRGTLSRVMFVFIIAGVVLSCMHQSSLGALMLIAPYKMHALWYTPILPLLFLLSAIAVGFPMVVFESMVSSWAFGRKPEMHVLTSLSKLIPILLGGYAVTKIADLVMRGALGLAFEGSIASNLFLAEMGFGVLLPLAMLLVDRVRKSPRLLLVASTLIVLGVAFNRINVFLVAYRPPFAEAMYVPTVAEVLITVGLISTLVLVYRALVTIFPVLPSESHDSSTVTSETAA